MKDKIEKPRSVGQRMWRIFWKSMMWFFIVTISWVVLYKWINPPTTWLQLTTSCPDGVKFQKKWMDSENISLSMKLAVVASEDNNFMKHKGIDWGAVEKAKHYNETTGKKKGKYRGASTITQQTAKNVFLWHGTAKWSKWIRKGFEVYFTYLIEVIWGKERIMEVYLNVIEIGPCTFGVEAASQRYLNTSAKKLSKEQAALIAAALPNPKKYSIARPGGYMKKRQAQIVRLMNLIGSNYFERYDSNMPKAEKEKEEKDVERKIKALPASELPAAVLDDGDDEEIPVEATPETPQDSTAISPVSGAE